MKGFAIVPGIKMGIFSPEELSTVLDIIKKHKIPLAKVTSAQRLALLGANKEQLEKITEELSDFVKNNPPQHSINYVQPCPGKDLCKFGIADSLGLAEKLEQISLSEALPAKIKIGVSACKMCCTEPFIRDIGFLATSKGWTLIFGGNGGGRPRIGDIVAKELNDKQAIDLAKKCINVYRQIAKKKQRTARLIEEIGINKFKQKVLT